MNDLAAIVVTYNRKALLRKCMESIIKQSYSHLDILIIDNASNDNTFDYISDLLDGERVFYYNTGKNIGGAGGFSFGIKQGLLRKYRYLWLMDDDTLPCPDALQSLIHVDEVLEGNYGFLSSAVLWTDGQPCKMNIPILEKPWYGQIRLLKEGILPCKKATFVSLLVKSEVVLKIGLPIKEFFIWGDDIEYTMRISDQYPCYVAGSSQVVHAMAANHGVNIAAEEAGRIDRYKYMYRNGAFIARKGPLKEKFIFLLKIVYHSFLAMFFSKGDRLKKLGLIISCSIRGLFFNPKIEYIQMKEEKEYSN